MSSVEEINDIEQLADRQLLWRSLLGETRGANFFLSLDWLLTYWRHFGSSKRLRALVIHSGERPVGILPLVVRKEATRLGPIRVLTYPLDDWGTFYGPIGPHPTATLMAGLGHIRRTPRDWDAIDLRWVDTERVDHGRTRNALRWHGFQAHREPWRQVGLVDVSGDWQPYWMSHSDRWRNNCRRAERKLAQQGRVRYIRYRPAGSACGDDDPRWDLYDACETVAKRSWQGSSTTGTTLSHPSVRPFLRDVHQVAAKAGAVDLNLITVDDRPIAFAYNYHFGGTVFGLRSGFDASASRDGAGTVLLLRMIRDSFERGEDQSFDMGPGSIERKRYWVTSVTRSYHYCHYPPLVVRAQALRLQRWFSGRRAGRIDESKTGQKAVAAN